MGFPTNLARKIPPKSGNAISLLYFGNSSLPWNHDLVQRLAGTGAPLAKPKERDP